MGIFSLDFLCQTLRSSYIQEMPKGLKRYYGQDHLHFLTCSCYHRQPWLASVSRRDLFLQILEVTCSPFSEQVRV